MLQLIIIVLLFISSCAQRDPLAFLPFRNFSAYGRLIHALFFIELCDSVRFVFPADVIESCEVVANGVFLSTESVAEMLAKRYQRSSHDAISDDLVMVGF